MSSRFRILIVILVLGAALSGALVIAYEAHQSRDDTQSTLSAERRQQATNETLFQEQLDQQATSDAATIAAQQVTSTANAVAFQADLDQAKADADATLSSVAAMNATEVAAMRATLDSETNLRISAENRNQAIHSRILARAALEAFGRDDHAFALAAAFEAATIETTVPVPVQRALMTIAYASGPRHAEPTENYIYDLAYRPDGQTALIGTSNGSLLWDAEAQTPIRELEGQPTLIEGVAFSPDGKLIATAGFDGSIMIQDMASGEVVNRWHGHCDTVYSVAFSPDGEILASGGGGLNIDEIYLWDVESGAMIRHLDGAGSELVFDVTFSPDGTLLATAGRYGHDVNLWDVAGGELLRTFNVPRGMNAFEVNFSPDGQHLAAALSGRVAIIWEVSSGETVQRIRPPNANGISTVAYSPDGSLLATGDGNGDIYLWDTRRWQQRGYFRQGTVIESLAFSPDGQHLLAGGRGADERQGLVMEWDVYAALQVNRFDEDTYYMDEVAIAADGHSLIAGDDEGAIRIITFPEGDIVHEVKAHEGRVWTVAMSSNGRRAVSAGDDNVAIIWDTTAGEMISFIKGIPIRSIAFSPDDTMLLIGNTHGLLALRDATDWNVIREWPSPDGKAVTGVAFSPDGSRLAMTTADGSISVLDRASGQEIASFTNPNRLSIDQVAFSGDGNRLVTSSSSRGFDVWDIPSNTLVFERRIEDVTVASVAFHPSGESIMIGGIAVLGDSYLALWDAKTGEVIHEYEGHPDRVIAIRFRPDGETALAVSSRKTFYPGNRIDISGSVIEWRTPTLGSLINWVQNNRYIREFTCEERREFDIQPLCSDSPPTLDLSR